MVLVSTSDLPLRLHERAHHAERADGLAVLEQKARDDRVVGLLSALQIVIALRVEGEVRAAVLKRDARAGDGDARAKAAVVALDKRDHVALCVRGAEVDRAAAVRVARFGLERPLSVMSARRAAR